MSGTLKSIVHIPHSAVLIELRALRLWHWRQVRRETKTRDNLDFMLRDMHAECIDRVPMGQHRDAARERWAFHMGAVQTLDVFFDTGDTAERDDA